MRRKPDETVGLLAGKKFTSKENTSSMIQISSLLKVSIKDRVEYRIIDDVLEEVRMMSNDYHIFIHQLKTYLYLHPLQIHH